MSDPQSTRPDNYPFGDPGRASARLLFDFSTGVGCFLDQPVNRRILDFACGTGWTSEWLSRIGYEVHGFDYDSACIDAAKARVGYDVRLNPDLLHFSVADGHKLPFPSNYFGHTFCFDSLHHMADYSAVFSELHRVTAAGGRCIFVEPGARHSSSPETVQFLAEIKKPAWWIEKDVSLLEVRDRALAAGFGEPRVKPFLLPSQVDYSVTDWFHFLDNAIGQQNHLREWRRSSWDDRVVFYLDKPRHLSTGSSHINLASAQ